MAGAAGGLAIFSFCVALAQMGSVALAAQAAQIAILLALLAIAFVAMFPRPQSGPVKVRVPIARITPAFTPPEPDVTLILAACAGAPLVAGAAMAFAVFH